MTAIGVIQTIFGLVLIISSLVAYLLSYSPARKIYFFITVMGLVLLAMSVFDYFCPTKVPTAPWIECKETQLVRDTRYCLPLEVR